MEHQEFILPGVSRGQVFAQQWRPDGACLAVIALVHGLGEHSSRYQHVAQFLTERGFGMVAMDLRGHGHSSGPRGHVEQFEQYYQDIDQLLAYAGIWQPGKPRFLYGHSLGGGIVLSYVLKRKVPITGVIATAPWLRTTEPISPLKKLMGRIFTRAVPSMTLRSGLERPALSRNLQVVTAYENDPLVHDRVSLRLGTEAIDNGFWALEHAGRLIVPLLLMHGEADRLTSFQASQEFANAAGELCTFKTWPGCYHELHNEPENQEVLMFTANWLESLIST